MITLPLLKSLFPKTSTDTLSAYLPIFQAKLPVYDISNRKRVAAFLAQVGHESANLTARVENLNYSSTGLRTTFPKYFNAAQAAAYARKPMAIASRCYANRMGNGNEASKDGWTYRGKGLIMVTGRRNHEAFAKWIGMTLTEATDYLLTVEGAVMGAVWFWTVNGLNELADGDQITNISKRVNGGTIGLEERKALWRKALSLI
jgi:putative chitinase